MSVLMKNEQMIAGLVPEELQNVTTSIAGLASTNQNSTTGIYYAAVDMSATIPDGYEIVFVTTIGNLDAFFYIPNGRRFLVCSPQSYSLSASVTRDLRVWYKKVS